MLARGRSERARTKVDDVLTRGPTLMADTWVSSGPG
jgi:hypothetical protein